MLFRQKRFQTNKILTSRKKAKVLASPEVPAPEKAADFDLNKQKESQTCREMEHGEREAAVSDPAEFHVGVTNTSNQTDIRGQLDHLSQPVKEEMEDHRPQSRDPLVVFSLNQQLQGQVEEVTKERDSLKEQVHILTRQLQEAQARSQAQQRSSPEEGLDYKSMFEKARQRGDELLKENQALQAAAESKLTQVQSQEEGSGDASKQIDCLLMELDKCRNERDRMLSEVHQ